MKNKVSLFLALIRFFGFWWLAGRIIYFFKIKLRILLWKMPVTSWEDYPVSKFLKNVSLADLKLYFLNEKRKAKFFYTSNDCQYYLSCLLSFDENVNESVVQKADLIEKGRFQYFSCHLIDAGFPPNWHKNIFTGEEAPKLFHWSTIGDFAYGDIKVIWELNRFGFVYDLFRAYWRTKNETYVELFWQLFENWHKNNMPNAGVNWKCGHEVSIRVLALCFAFYAFLASKKTTKHRLERLLQVIICSTIRVEKNIKFALRQKNDHSVNESACLWIVGVLFPELSLAANWQKSGQYYLEKLALTLFYNDGAFCMSSLNYHRLALNYYLIVLRLADLNKITFSQKVKARINAALMFLFNMQDQVSGRLPNYGANDGSLLVRLTNCNGRDFRPIIQLGYYYFYRKRIFNPGPWDEALLWLFGPKALNSPVETVKQRDVKISLAGYYILRSREGFIFMRCCQFKHRPSQADLLHVDLWWKGINLLKDAGTYSYNAPKPWNNPFVDTKFHNTITVDQQSQMKQVSKFILLPWPKGFVSRQLNSQKTELSYFEVWHNSYCSLKDPVIHIRAIVRLTDEHWIILDKLIATDDHMYELCYLCEDLPFQFKDGKMNLKTMFGNYNMVIDASVELDYCVTHASKKTVAGWHSPYYYESKSAISIVASGGGNTVLFATVMGPSMFNVKLQDARLTVHYNNNLCDILLNETKKLNIASNIKLLGNISDFLKVD